MNRIVALIVFRRIPARSSIAPIPAQWIAGFLEVDEVVAHFAQGLVIAPHHQQGSHDAHYEPQVS